MAVISAVWASWRGWPGAGGPSGKKLKQGEEDGRPAAGAPAKNQLVGGLLLGSSFNFENFPSITGETSVPASKDQTVVTGDVCENRYILMNTTSTMRTRVLRRRLQTKGTQRG